MNYEAEVPEVWGEIFSKANFSLGRLVPNPNVVSLTHPLKEPMTPLTCWGVLGRRSPMIEK